MKQERTIVFVCEHGAAKSVVAAAHFNRLAGGRGLRLRAVARGTNPDAEIAPNAARGLRADGLEDGEWSPEKLTQADAAGAARVVTFCELPEGYVTAAPVERWDEVPPVSEGYANARDAMVEHIHRFLNRLEAEDQPTPGQDEPR